MLARRLAALGTAAFVMLGSTAAWADTTIKYSSWLPPAHFLWTDVYVPFFEEIEKVTEGRVKVEVLPKVVGTAASQIEVVRDGLADMSFTVASYTPGRYVASEVGELPLLGNDAAVMGPAYYRHFKEYIEPAGEYDGIKVLSIWMISPLQPHTEGRPIHSVDDFKGLKLRTPNPNTVMALELLGGVPILKSSTEAFEMLATGAIDGQITIPNTVPGFNQLDLLDAVTIIPGGMSNAVNLMFINADKWAEISEEDRKAIEEVAGEKLARDIGVAYMKADEEALKTFRDNGYEVIEGDDTLRAELAEKLKPVEEAWIKRAEEKGVKDPAGQLAALRAAIAEGEKARQ